jgi:hypothetical protein
MKYKVVYTDTMTMLQKHKVALITILNECLDKGYTLDELIEEFQNRMFFHSKSKIVEYIKNKRPDKLHLITGDELNLL